MKEIDLAYRTLYAELLQRSLDGGFVHDFEAASGNFVTVTVKGRAYWYFDKKTEEGTTRTYVGPADDPEVARRVDDFKSLKSDFVGRRKLVSTLVREAGLMVPERLTGDLVEALANAGLFRLRAVLVGTVAYQCYGAVLGVRLPAAAMQTGDTDVAQFHAVSAAVDDTMPPMLETLRGVDPSFRQVPHQMDGRYTTRYVNDSGFQVEFLTPNAGGASHEGRPSPMPALGGAAAEPLRFLDFLINEPVRAVMLHRAGVPVLVPGPERFAVHKLIVASRRRPESGKRDKDLLQASTLAEALALTRRQAELAVAFVEAWKRGQAWRKAIHLGVAALPQPDRARLEATLAAGLAEIGEEPATYSLAGAAVP